MRSNFFFAFILLSLHGFSQNLRILDLSGNWKFTIGDREEYGDLEYNDANWEYIEVPRPWEAEGFSNYNGYAWYRYTFDGKELRSVENLTLNLGYIDDVHEAYLNGELLGFKGSFPPNYYTAYNALNEYTIPKNLVNPDGKNVIAVKVYDLTQEGGIVKGKDLGIWYSPVSEKFINLSGVWSFTTTEERGWRDPDLNDNNWDKILVPSFWRSKHIKWPSRNDAWYRKEFYLPEEFKDKDLLLSLGRIDDFDFTYLNGEFIGSTKDDRQFGLSGSYLEYRVYQIPKEKLNQNGRNIISILVEDLGGDAGIYEGPIGLFVDYE